MPLLHASTRLLFLASLLLAAPAVAQTDSHPLDKRRPTRTLHS